jgi:hypothetical protein
MPTVSADLIDFPAFGLFSQLFFLHDHFTISNCVSEIFKCFFPKIGSGYLDPLNDFPFHCSVMHVILSAF